MNALILADGLIALLREVLPEIQSMVNKGDITVEEQQKRMKQIEALHAQRYDGPEWIIEKTSG